MTRPIGIALLLLALPSLTAAQIEFPALQVKLGNYLREAAYDEGSSPIVAARRAEYFALSGEDAAFSGLLTAYPARFYGLERYEMTRFDTAWEGMGQGATLGLFAGAVGTTAGLFGEDTAWAVAGGMAALGALLGGTYGARDPAMRIRYRWRPPPEHYGADELHRPNP